MGKQNCLYWLCYLLEGNRFSQETNIRSDKKANRRLGRRKKSGLEKQRSGVWFGLDVPSGRKTASRVGVERGGADAMPTGQRCRCSQWPGGVSLQEVERLGGDGGIRSVRQHGRRDGDSL